MLSTPFLDNEQVAAEAAKRIRALAMSHALALRLAAGTAVESVGRVQLWRQTADILDLVEPTRSTI